MWHWFSPSSVGAPPSLTLLGGGVRGSLVGVSYHVMHGRSGIPIDPGGGGEDISHTLPSPHTLCGTLFITRFCAISLFSTCGQRVKPHGEQKKRPEQKKNDIASDRLGGKKTVGLRLTVRRRLSICFLHNYQVCRVCFQRGTVVTPSFYRSSPLLRGAVSRYALQLCCVWR